ncbi:hypothetical protein J132_01130 [Termitomyces sp. J132]|nr:hypothetical protein H2248_011962 [Termitomyces sp. 'cryptogamus']KNZ78350.1 hypothetical protein J132_01130 [Termitomyces sp. J132]
MAPILVTSTDETSQLISAAKRRQNDLVDFQIPRLRSCQGPLSLQQNLAAELREDIDSFAKQVEALELSIGDQRGEKNRAEMRRIVDEFQSDLARLRRDSRAALLASKRAIDSQRRSQREELLASSAVTEKANLNEKIIEDPLMKANDNVTEVLRRTLDLMQNELKRSVLSAQMLDASTASLSAASSTHDTLTNLTGTSKQLITALEKSDWIDRVLIISAFVFFLLVVLFVIKQRIVDRGLRLAFWWTRFLPDFSEDPALMDIEKQNNPAFALTTSLISSVLSVTATMVASSTPTSLIPPTDYGGFDAGKSEPSISIETSSVTLPFAVPSSTTEDSSDELHHIADEL